MNLREVVDPDLLTTKAPKNWIAMITTKTFSIILASLFAATLTTVAFASDNPLREFFPYGVYVSGTGDPESLDRVCADLKAHHMNAVWLSGAPAGNVSHWLEAG